jgi:hypothetical protein
MPTILVGESGGLSVGYGATTRVLVQRDSAKVISHERFLPDSFPSRLDR